MLGDTRLFAVLLQTDKDLAKSAWMEGCRNCGGVLHRANFPRKPRGGPSSLTEANVLRFSFCCAREGRRRRKTPPSVE